MAEIRYCANCNGIFNYTGMVDICPLCVREEEAMFEKVYQFLKKRENRTSTVERIVEKTGVTTTLLFKWVQKGHLHPSRFPNLGYPCANCGEIIVTGNKLCDPCTNNLKDELDAFEASQETISTLSDTYRAQGKTKTPVKSE